ncbi:MAG TPA: tetratricopeptide repeat protein [Caldilineaceae bacterium]|nr:tetratricopeptide repeat protein [Caldilineaceae bacterium]
MAIDTPDFANIIRLLRAMAPLMEQVGHRNNWRATLVQGCALCQRMGHVAAEADVCYHIGILYHRERNFAVARKWLTDALRAYEVAADRGGQSKTLHQLAYIACLQRKYDQAAKLVEEAAPLADDDPILRAMTYFLKGTIASDFQRWHEAELLFREALALRTVAGDQRRIAWSLLDLAWTLRKQNSHDEAIACCQESAAIFLSLHDMQSWAASQMNLGLLHHQTGDDCTAVEHYSAAIPHFKSCGDLLNLAKVYTNLGLAFLKLKQPNEAEKAFIASIEHCRLLADHYMRLNATDGLTMALLRQQRYNDAMATLEAALAELPLIKDSPNYDYLYNSMRDHLAEAQLGQSSQV